MRYPEPNLCRRKKRSDPPYQRDMVQMPVGHKTCRSGPRSLERPNMVSLHPAHRLPYLVLFTHPARRFQHCLNGPPFFDDKTSGGGAKTERRAEMTIMLVSARWGSRRGGGVRESVAGRGAQRGPTQGRPKSRSTEGSQSKTREWQGTGRCDGPGLSAKRSEKQRSGSLSQDRCWGAGVLGPWSAQSGLAGRVAADISSAARVVLGPMVPNVEASPSTRVCRA